MKKILSFFVMIPFFLHAQEDGTYQLTKYYKVPTADPIPVPSSADAKMTITYFDGLGRPIQHIENKQSGTGKNLVTPIEYDAYGRKYRDYLPYESSSSSLDYESNALDNVTDFELYEGQNPYFEKKYENSSLNRITKQSSPGSDWVMGSGKERKHETFTNTSLEVRYFAAVATWSSANMLYSTRFISRGNYDSGSLQKIIYKDENWTSGNEHTTQDFFDKEGRIVLKRIWGNSIKQGVPVSEWHDTYYVYDQFGNLTYVLPPLSDLSGSQQDLNVICYQYNYDEKNRLGAKKIPGRDWEFIVYDKHDRLVASGPFYSPFGNGQKGWNVAKYDELGRVAYSGWFNGMVVNRTGRKNFQTEINNQASTSERQGTLSNINNVAVNYTNITYPTTQLSVLLVNHYDTYDFLWAPPSFTNGQGQSSLYGENSPRGLITGQWSRIITTADEAKADVSYYLYDNRERVVREHIKNYLEGYTQTELEYNFAGQVTNKVSKHKRLNSSTEIYVKELFTYNEQDRLDTHSHQIGQDGIPQLIAKNEYDQLGRVIRKSVGGSDLSGSAALQKVDYRFNIKGWLLEINDISNLNQGSDPTDFFAFKINYNQTETHQGHTEKLYNGNIAETYWRTISDNNIRSYGYSYDAMSRLNKAYYAKNNHQSGSYNEEVTYDKNGNIQFLSRYGDYDVYGGIEIDNLGYFYNAENPNQLKQVKDYSGNPSGFRATDGDQFDYDSFGNMVRDENKGMGITYNHLNLPVKISFDSGNFIQYIYDGSGKKVGKTVHENGESLQTDYLSGFQYFKGKLQFFPTSEGYVRKIDDVDFQYVFNYLDHLGNVRLSYSSGVLEENHYYPFGMKHENYNTAQGRFSKISDKTVIAYDYSVLNAEYADYKYRFNGKEFQDELGLNLYDYGARNYDPAIGRWMNIDPLAEMSWRFSPYSYANNNPVYFIDPDGMMAEEANFGWIKKENGGYYRDPNVHRQEDLENQKETYICEACTIERPDGVHMTFYDRDDSLGDNWHYGENPKNKSGQDDKSDESSDDVINLGDHIDKIIDIDVYFESSSSILKGKQDALESLLLGLISNKNITIEIFGNVSLDPSQVNRNSEVKINGRYGKIKELQLLRAKSIEAFLIANGIDKKRLSSDEGKIFNGGVSASIRISKK